MRKSPNGPFLNRTGPPPGPPSTLKENGRALWNEIQLAYGIDDAGGLEMLSQCCHAADRAAECAAVIASEGLTVVSGSGTPHEHPLLRCEQAARSFVVKTLKSLGLHVEPLRRGPGRPPVEVPVPYGIMIDGEDNEWESPNSN